ncbi:MAG: riboflavin biosynthesis protein RibF [Oscillospiraceae bacterium]|nr:riboflavin biosynthesis protein RibF [Oscillospiraceae bacterium]
MGRTKSTKKILALGIFDGIHIGHAKLIESARERAAQLDARPAVLTFDSHPDTYVRGERVELISSAADRVYIINEYFGVEDVYFLHFNAEVMRMSWRDFLDDVLATYSTAGFVVGHDFTFGFKGEGNAEKLALYAAEKGLSCDVIPAVTLDGITVSSTYIRSLLLSGDIERANRFLGHPYLLTDTVRTGKRIGRKMDAPTVNMLIGEGVLVPRHGVYASRAVLPDGQERAAVTNIGVRPTFGGGRVTAETNILHFDADLYGQRLCVQLYSFLRPERRFATPAELMTQIHADARQAEAYFG